MSPKYSICTVEGKKKKKKNLPTGKASKTNCEKIPKFYRLLKSSKTKGAPTRALLALHNEAKL